MGRLFLARLLGMLIILTLFTGIIVYEMKKPVKTTNAITGSLNVTTPNISSPTISGNANFPGGIWNSSGNVGIGTVSPGAKLDVSDWLQ